MSWLLSVVGWSFFALAVSVGLLLDLAGLFGNWVILGAVASAWAFSGFDYFDGWTLAILLGLAVVGEIFEALSSGVGTAKYGGGKGAVTASLVGCVLGAIAGTPVFPVVGTLAGACAGAFSGAALYELLMREKELDAALRVGLGAVLGRVAGVFLKTFVGVAMLIVAALRF